MKFENRGKWMQEAEDKLAAYDTQEHPDYLDGDNKVCAFEEEDLDAIEDTELDMVDEDFEEDELDLVEEDDTLDSPEEEEMDLAMEAAMPPMGQRKRIEFEDDIVKVYDGNKEIYAGAEDYEPMQDEDWKWDNTNKYYKFGKYIKVCCESSQKNEALDLIGGKSFNDYYNKLKNAFKSTNKITVKLYGILLDLEISKTSKYTCEVQCKTDDSLVTDIQFYETKEDLIKAIAKKIDDIAYSFKNFNESSQKNEDNMSELKKELDYLYKGIGWAEWEYFIEGLQMSNFKPQGITHEKLVSMINASGIAKVKKVKDIKNYSSMEDFDPKDFRPNDEIIVTKKPMSSQFHGESSQKNEGKATAQKFKNWSKRNQVKAAIDKADEKTFEKLMNDFCLNVAKGDYFPQTKVKKGKLLFALTDEPITLDSIEKYFVEDEYLFESAQKNETLDLGKLSSDDANKLAKYFNDFAKDKTMRYDLIDKIEDILKKKYKAESSQKNEGPEEFKDNKYEKDFFEYKNGGHGDFMEYLAKACMQADKKNLAKIQKEFPELTKAFCLWKSSGKTDRVEKL